jgi:hypothetical protein
MKEGGNMLREKEVGYMNAHRLYLLIGIFSILLHGCATTMEIKPQVAQIEKTDFRIKGKIIYEGNKEYLPRVLVDQPISDNQLVFKYMYKAIYGKHDVPDLVALYNPLTIVGFPTGENTLTILGKLDVLKGEEVIKSYTATCILEKTRSLFSEGTFTEMRKKGLIAVRNNIEIQMYLDKDYLEKLFVSD